MATGKKKVISESKEVPRKDWTPIVVAIIGTFGVVVAALIAVLPNMNSSKKEVAVTQTPNSPVGFNKYDDPLGTFSFDLPSNFVIFSRDVADKEISVGFHTTQVEQSENTSEIPASQDIVTGHVQVGILDEPVVLSDIDSVNENNLMQALGDTSFGKRNLISSQRTPKGYFMKLEEIGKSGHLFIYYLVEYDGKSYILLTFMTNEESDLLYGESIKHSVESFTWNSEKILNYFKIQ